MREWRRTHTISEEERHKQCTRSVSRTCLRGGFIGHEPCERCGYLLAEMHHDDYDDPYRVRWFCRPCHLNEHGRARWITVPDPLDGP